MLIIPCIMATGIKTFISDKPFAIVSSILHKYNSHICPLMGLNLVNNLNLFATKLMLQDEK